MTIAITDAWNGPGNKDGELSLVVPKDHGLHASTSRRAFEHWYFDARLESGHTIVGFLTKRRPEQGANCDPSVELIVYGPDGSKIDARVSFPKDQARFSTDDVDVRIGPNRCWVDRSGPLPVQRVVLAAGELAFDLAFANELPSWMPGKGETYYGARDHFGWVVAAPRARVSGTLTIGGAVLDATGIGYADHNWGVGDMKRIIERWHWGRLYTDEHSLLFANVITQARFDHHQSAPLMLADRDGVLLSTGEVTLTEGPMHFHPGANREHPEWIQLEVPGELTLRLDVERIIDAQDLLDEVPVVRSRVVKPIVHKLVGRPGYFRFDSRFTLSIAGREPVVGHTLHEMVALR
ncbi:hypothetical protein Back2_00180 [Nocardioides baekrokdamisoli]|uniref:AttH domain-containing protein n=1 Tax=Nocardioides baekrokdamisoli TaxID=1804624 RepID=A0A3G9IQ43_9ACTN|nr:hypothetical protein [Nocardioides baekrokdamisoli]BBH15731.1 hypothetical protein Back2_00180 [Nocardioides baekrokdamisoli]